MIWQDKRYHSFNYYIRKTFGEKLVKLSFDGGFSCPNRDGTKGYNGCIFCNEKGSGDFTPDKQKPILEQYKTAKSIINKKWPNKRYIGYLQAFSNTYAPPETLHKKYNEILEIEDIMALSIATRPDCIDDDIANLIATLSKKYNKPIYVELGLQSSKKETQEFLKTKYNNNDFVKACQCLTKNKIPIISHIILGLPYETKNDMLNTVRFATSKETNISGVKFHSLYILENTELAKSYENKEFKLLSFDEYVDIVVSCLKITLPEIVIHRLTGDGPKNKLIAPLWSRNKIKVLNAIDKSLKEQKAYQGCLTSI